MCCQVLVSDDGAVLSRLRDFSISRRGYGTMRWLDPVDVRGLELDAIVYIGKGRVVGWFRD